MKSRNRPDAFPTEEAAVLLRARVVSGALMGGVATFACVSAFLVYQGTIGDVAPGGVHAYLPVGFVAAIGLLAVAPMLARMAARGAASAPAGFLLETIVKQALREGVGMAGIVFSMLTAHIEWILAFAVASLLAMGLGWPSREALRNATRERRA